MQLYVRAKSKAEINKALAAGEAIKGTHYTPWSCEDHILDSTLPAGSVIKVFDKFVGGSPYAKAYGQWDPIKNRVK